MFSPATNVTSLLFITNIRQVYRMRGQTTVTFIHANLQRAYVYALIPPRAK